MMKKIIAYLLLLVGGLFLMVAIYSLAYQTPNTQELLANAPTAFFLGTFGVPVAFLFPGYRMLKSARKQIQRRE